MNLTGKIALLVLLCSTVSAAARAPQATLSVRVVDPSGASIGDALVVVHAERAGNKPGRRDGLTRLPLAAAATFRKELPAGEYDIFIAEAGFYPACKKVHLQSGETNAIEITLKVENVTTIVTSGAGAMKL